MIATNPPDIAPTIATISFDSISFSEVLDIFLETSMITPKQPSRETAWVHAGPVFSHTVPLNPIGFDLFVFMFKVRLGTWGPEVVRLTSYGRHEPLVTACARYDLHLLLIREDIFIPTRIHDQY